LRKLADAGMDESKTACVARAEYIVKELSGCVVRDGWAFDTHRAARFLENLRTFDNDDGDDARFIEVLAWIKDHCQCPSWIFLGDPGGMICGGAGHSPGRRRIRVLEEA